MPAATAIQKAEMVSLPGSLPTPRSSGFQTFASSTQLASSITVFGGGEGFERKEFDFSSSEARPSEVRERKVEREVTRDAKLLLLGDMARIGRTLEAIAMTKANTSQLRLMSLRTYLFRDPEENTKKLVMEVFVEANAAQAMALWEAVGRAVDLWREGLPPYLREMLVRRWSVHVRW